MENKTEIDPLDIPGFINFHQINAITLIANSLKKFEKKISFLELGPGIGRSTTAWMNSLPDTASIHVLDSWMLNSENFAILENLLETRSYFKEGFNKKFKKTLNFLNNHGQYNLWKKNVFHNINYKKIKKVYSISFSEFLLKNEKKFDCVYVDMLDNEEEIFNCLDYFGDSLIVCGDDYLSDRHPYVTKAVNRYIEKQLESGNIKHLYVFPEANFFAIVSLELSSIVREQITGK